MDTNYQLVNSVDPSKCQPRIKEKFAKLTLSSNKKKQQDAEVIKQIREEARLSNVSRNLLSELLTDDECDEEQKVPQKVSQNLLVRTDSSPSNEVAVTQRPKLDNSDSTHCSEIDRSFHSCEMMEPLRVSDVGMTEPQHEISNAVEQLSSRLSLLAVAPAPIIISSNEDSHEVSQIVSTQNQRVIGCGQRLSGIFVEEPAQQPEVSICISSTSNGDNDTPITVTDSEDEFDAINISSSAVSLPPTQESTKDMRMAAFLRDVRLNYGLPMNTPERDTENREKKTSLADTEPMPTDNTSLFNDFPEIGAAAEEQAYNAPIDTPDREARDRQREIATADTEPMTTEDNSISFSVARRIATADTVSNTTDDRSPVKSLPEVPQRDIAYDDTVDMTPPDETVSSSPHFMPVMNVGTEFLEDSREKLSSSLPDDSLTIAETSEEEAENEEKTPESQPPQSASQEPLRPSQTISEVTSKDSSQSSAHDTQVHINISTKINIKIQVSQAMNQSVSSESTKTSHSDSKGSTESSDDDHAPPSSAQKAQIQENPIEDIPHSPPVRDISLDSSEMSEKSDDFAETAQRILNEVYGDSWRTPEVIRTIKKVTATSSRRANMLRPKRLEIEGDLKDESTIDDFSIFRRNIPQDLDSTRLPATPLTTSNTKVASRILQKSREMNAEMRKDDEKPERQAGDEPESRSDLCDGMAYLDLTKDSIDSDEEEQYNKEQRKSPKQQKASPKAAPDDQENEIKKPFTPLNTFKVPKAATDSKALRRNKLATDPIRPLATPQGNITKTKSGREVRARWRALVDSSSESEGENASDEQDKSWSKSDIDDEKDYPEEKEEDTPPKPLRTRVRNKNASRSKKNNGIVYLDLSKDEVEIQNDAPESPPANHDERFNRRLEEILKTCKPVDKPKIECTPNVKTKRKLFTARLNDDDENIPPPFDSPKERRQAIDQDEKTISISGVPMPAKFEPFNKHLESVKSGKPVFKILTPQVKRDVPKTPKSTLKDVDSMTATPRDKYGFLQSLDLCVGKSLAHPDALYYRDNFRLKKDELTQKLYELYNKHCFNQELNVPITWNKKLTNTAGRCTNRKRLGERACAIELSDKVITSADRLRCTLIHELCHAATWIFNGEGGHGATWKAWARKANQVFPELPKISVCHQYEIEYKYTYKCTLCGAKSYAHSKSKKVENIRCSYCHGAIEVYLNKRDKEGNTIATPVREPTGFAKFVKDKYKQYKRPDLKHADVMKLLSNEFASMKVDVKA